LPSADQHAQQIVVFGGVSCTGLDPIAPASASIHGQTANHEDGAVSGSAGAAQAARIRAINSPAPNGLVT